MDKQKVNFIFHVSQPSAKQHIHFDKCSKKEEEREEENGWMHAGQECEATFHVSAPSAEHHEVRKLRFHSKKFNISLEKKLLIHVLLKREKQKK